MVDAGFELQPSCKAVLWVSRRHVSAIKQQIQDGIDAMA
jgi:hypothetical protein